MKKLNKYIMLFVAAFALVSCVDDVTDTPTLESKVGENVQFGLTLPSARTIYGPEDNKNNTFPIYWAEGDKVQIYSPECLEGRNNAEYKVILPTGSATPNYAMDLQITGANGVQWGEATTANFYSVYPSSGAKFEGTGDNVSVTMNIASEQSVSAALDKSGDTPTYYAADMTNVIMYAQKVGAEAGKTVDLQYNPYSTVIEFALNVPADATGSIRIKSIKLEANTAISGNFKLSFDPEGKTVPTVDVVSDNSNTVAMNFTVTPELKAGQTTLKAKMALMPIGNVTTLDGWKVSVAVINGDNSEGTFVRTFPATSTGLVAGKVHKIQLPALSADKEWEYKPAVWMQQLKDYTKIYLTEYSIPGAWYAHDPGNEGYQVSGESISNLWNNGIRAFAVECRSAKGSRWDSGSAPNCVVMSGTGDSAWTSDAYVGGTKIRELIKQVANQVKDSDEFAVLILSYADGGEKGQRDTDHKFFINGLKTEIANAGVDNIYTDAITANTTTQDVLNHVIIKINVDEELSKESYDNSSPALFSYVPHMNQLSSDLYSTPLFSKMYWKTWEDSYEVYSSSSSSEFLWCFTSANRTHVDGEGTYVIPTYSQRKEALDSMMEHSDQIYANSTHNVWFYFNAGGTEATDIEGSTTVSNFATNMNQHLLDVINLKSNGGQNADGNIVYAKPSPLGIVMFNQCSSDKGKEIIKAIIELNNKCELKKAGEYNSSNDDNQTDEEEEGA